MKSQSEWLAYFDEQARAWAAARHESISRSLAEKYRTNLVSVAAPFVFEPGHEIDSGSDDVPVTAARLVETAQACGWATRLVASSAADPTKGAVRVLTLRAGRHDERVWAAWRNGAFECAWYVGPTGLERLGVKRMSCEAAAGGGAVSVDSLTVAAMLEVAKEHGIVIPSKDRRKDLIVAALMVNGVREVKAPRPVRGVADALEGIRISLTRH